MNYDGINVPYGGENVPLVYQQYYSVWYVKGKGKSEHF